MIRFSGALVTVNVLCITTGQFISYLTNSAFSYLSQGSEIGSHVFQ
jgi:hypothetical protein